MIGNALRTKFWAEELAWRTQLKKNSAVFILGHDEDSYTASFTKQGMAALASNVFEAFKKGNHKLAHADNTFNLVFITYAWHELHDGRIVAAECYRVLKYDGNIFILTQSHEQLRCKPLFKFFPEAIDNQLTRYPNIPDIIEVLRKVGFKSIVTSTYYWAGSLKPSDYIDVAERNLCPELTTLPDEARQKGVERLRAHITKRGNVPFRDDDTSTLVAGKKE